LIVNLFKMGVTHWGLAHAGRGVLVVAALQVLTAFLLLGSYEAYKGALVSKRAEQQRARQISRRIGARNATAGAAQAGSSFASSLGANDSLNATGTQVLTPGSASVPTEAGVYDDYGA
jgi:hypothetical protein